MALDEVNTLIREAGDAALEIVLQQNILLDAVDAFEERNTGNSRSNQFKRRDVLTTVDALAVLPSRIATQLEAWTSGDPPLVSAKGFEENVLIELAVYLNALYDFTVREHLATPGFKQDLVLHAVERLKNANRAVGKCYGEL